MRAWSAGMGFLAVWLVLMGAATPVPRTPAHDLFVRKGCAHCHQLKGIKEAKGKLGPDLGKLVASRSVGELTGFLAHPDMAGRGNHLPSLDLTPRQVALLVELIRNPPRKPRPTPSPRPTPRPSPSGF
ncbi:MAG: c-type cytochrome [Candidatus Sericytochromatia bacterium]|nr:c-type cytochrome [Candidatus Sericytochromatia bacterium]